MILTSNVVPTEYDVWREGIWHIVMDDHGRTFRGLTQQSAFNRAERAQDPKDPIHHV